MKISCYMLLVSTLFSVAFALQAEEKTVTYQILDLAGKPAVSASVTVVRWKRFGNKKPVIETPIIIDGKFTIKKFNRFPGGYLKIEVPGAALGYWNFLPADGILGSQKSFNVKGTVQWPDKTPVVGAQVIVDHLGIGTYAYLFFPDGREGLTAKTVADGSFTLPGATLNGYEFPIGAQLGIIAEKDGFQWGGSSRISFRNPDIPIKHPGSGMKFGSTFTIHPATTLTGVFIDGDTRTPVSGVRFNVNIRLEKQIEVVSDKEGKFHVPSVGISGFQKFSKLKAKRHLQHFRGKVVKEDETTLTTYRSRQFSVRDPRKGGAAFNIIECVPPSAKKRQVDHLKIVFPKMVNLKGKIIDSHSGKAPLCPITLRLSTNEKVSDRWTQQFVPGHCHVDSDGKFSLRVPVGDIKLEAFGIGKNGVYAYQGLLKITIPPSGKTKNIKVKVDRQPGIL